MRLKLILGAALAAVCLPVHACDEKPVRPFDVEQSRFRLMLAQGQYDELDRWAAKSEDLAQRISDGQSLHAVFLAALRMPLPCRAASMDPVRMMAAEGYRSRLREWLERSPGSRSAQVANALSPLSFAWAARGTGYASSVDAAAWPIFKENIAKARGALESLPAGTRDDPGWYAAMLEILKLQSASQGAFEAVLAEAAARYPDYEMIWFEAGSYYEPKWGGDPAKVRALAERAADATRARLGDTMYARVQWSSSDAAMFRSGQADWARMKAGFERLMKDYPDNWNANNFGRFACRAEDADGLRKAFAHIQKPILAVWDVVPYDSCARHVNDPAPAQQVSR